MKISNTGSNSVSFSSALTSSAALELEKLGREGQDALGFQDDYTIFDIPSFSFYSDKNCDTGRGKLNSDEGLKIISTLKPYVGFDAVKDYPIGRNIRHTNHFNCPYDRSSITIGEDNINFSKLTTYEYGCLLDRSDVSELVQNNLATRRKVNKINYENELGTSIDYPILKPLKKAYKNFQKYHKDKSDFLRREFEDFKTDPITRNFDRIALYPFVAGKDPNLFLNFNNSKQKQKRFEQYKKEYKDEIEFFKFRQFLAYKNLKEAKENLNSLGVEVINDVAIGFSPEEYWAFKDAFDSNHTIGYNFLFPRYARAKDKNSAIYDLIKNKMELNLRLADGLRMDVGVSYFQHPKYKKDPKTGESDFEHPKKYNNGEIILELIENTAKEIKGEDFDLRKIVYEADGEGESLFDFSNDGVKLKKEFKKRNLMFTTIWEHLPKNDFGWGSVDYFTNVVGIDPDYSTIGTVNHDWYTTRQVAESYNETYAQCKEDAKKVLAKNLDIDEKDLDNPKNFVKAKFEELYSAKRRFFYFIDVLGRKEYINDQTKKGKAAASRFRDRLDENFESDFHKELQKGNAFNRPETIATRMKKTGADITNPALYEKLNYLGQYLRKKGALTQEQADKEARANGYDEVMSELQKIDAKYEK